MTLTKFGHACIRLEDARGCLVIDPGSLTEQAAVVGADAVLVTHEHFDHFSAGQLEFARQLNPDLQVWTVRPVADLLVGWGTRVHVVEDGDEFTAGGHRVQALGSLHAPVHRDVPSVRNTGFLVDGRVFHPGDSLALPGVAVETLLVPVCGTWVHLDDVIDWARAVGPHRVLAVHDGGLNAVGLALVDGLLGANGPGLGARYRRLDVFQELCGDHGDG